VKTTKRLPDQQDAAALQIVGIPQVGNMRNHAFSIKSLPIFQFPRFNFRRQGSKKADQLATADQPTRARRAWAI
jgi:hypothetical protein